MKLIHKLTVALLFLAFDTSAKTEVTDGTVVWVGAVDKPQVTGSYVVIKGGLWSGESVCSGTTNTHQWYFIKHDSPVAQQMLSIALTSLATGNTARIYGNGECTDNGFENISTIFSISEIKYN
ncbi:hypothetical protein Sps_03016 [Shewanella psychrophila]|uniref:Uncharacterized protein n=1 Tax=Shewanella psychrophila TaxID=225848 RepID=A0A1S6HRL8_9GAMM|nr:hypothetical protein [Shewanella psychrophila]AQS38163.1 hypothetical protein Sps_03016 [Shewanella psychrophila]